MKKAAQCPSYPVSIFLAGDAADAVAISRAHCDEVGLCVTVTPTTYVYTGGQEAGIVVGLINYPRFPKEPEALWQIAEMLGTALCVGLGQQSYSIQAPDRTVWISHRAEDAA